MPVVWAWRALAIALAAYTAYGAKVVRILPDEDDAEDAVGTIGKPKKIRRNRSYEPTDEWLNLPPPRVPNLKTKLVVMMLAKYTIYNPRIWDAWLAQAERDQTAIDFKIHAKAAQTGWHRGQPQYLHRVLNDSEHTEWGYLVRAERKLLNESMMDKTATHFVLVSADSIPVKSARWMIDQLEKNPDTRFCAADNKNPPRAEMWWVPRRRDATLFRDHFDMIRSWKTLAGDEKAWYFPIRRRYEKWGREDAGFSKECIMFTDWQTGINTTHTWGEHLGQCGCPSLLDEKQRGAEPAHPNTYESIMAQSMKELMHSRFWFARKIGRKAVSEEALGVAVGAWR